MPGLTLHRGPYELLGRRSLRCDWHPNGELGVEIETDAGERRMKLSAKQVDRLVSFLLQPYIGSNAEEVSPVGKSGKGKGKSGGKGGRC